MTSLWHPAIVPLEVVGLVLARLGHDVTKAVLPPKTISRPFNPLSRVAWSFNLVFMTLAYRQPDHIEMRAVVCGSVQVLCPKCTHFIMDRVPWRSARVICPSCKGVFGVGVACFDNPIDLPPHSGWFADVYSKWTNNTVNRYPEGRFNTGRAVGKFRWVCPNSHVNKGEIDWSTGKVCCDQCDSCYHVALVLYPTRTRQPDRTPVDWIIPDHV